MEQGNSSSYGLSRPLTIYFHEESDRSSGNIVGRKKSK